MWTTLSCDEPYLSIEDIIRLVSLSDGTNTALRVVIV
jgi:hypothetical protein